MRQLAFSAAFAVLACATGAAAQQDTGQVASLVAGGVEELGQSVGEAALSGSSVFVTATGHASLPTQVTDGYLFNIEGQSASAAEASRAHDQRLATVKSIAARYNVTVEIGSTSFGSEIDPAFTRRNSERIQAQIQTQIQAGHPVQYPVTPPGEPERLFVERTGVRLVPSAPDQLPALLDALKAAGVETLLDGSSGVRPVNMFVGAQVMGFGALADVDDAAWDRASQDAMAHARRQAEVLAAASGRKIGEVKQIVMLSRSVEGDRISLTVAVRYQFASDK